MAEASELKKVSGVFLQMGSRDFPFNYSFNDPYGFDPDNDIPIFKYSLNEVISGFDAPITLSKPGVIDNNLISFLVTEGQNNEAIKSEDLSSLEWQNIYSLIEWMYANQSTILSITEWPDKDVYSSFPDYVFRNVTIEEGFNQDLTNYISTYVSKSIYYIASTKKDRISFIEFRCKIKDVPKDFKVYFDADDFVSTYSGSKFFVYYYKDLDGDDSKITQTEFDKSIIESINSGIMQKEWRTMKQYTTLYCAPQIGEDGGITHKDGVNRTFYVYSNLPIEEFTTQIMIDQIRQQLIADNNDSEDDLSNQYPNLFTDQEVYIYPIHDNIQLNKNEGNAPQVVHPLSYSKLQEVMRMQGLALVEGADGFRNCEIFYVGFDVVEKNTMNKYIFPLLAADYSVDKTKLPITSRFINYSPRSFADYTGTGSDDDKFQFILMNILGYFQKHFEKEAFLQNLESISSSIDLTITDATDQDYANISFKLKNTKFIIVWYTTSV